MRGESTADPPPGVLNTQDMAPAVKLQGSNPARSVLALSSVPVQRLKIDNDRVSLDPSEVGDSVPNLECAEPGVDVHFLILKALT